MNKEKGRVPKLRFPGFTEDWEQRKFGELFEYERPDAYIVKSDNYNNDFNMPVLTANKAFILGYTNEENSYNKPSIIFDDFTLDRKYVDFPYMLKSSAIKILTSKNQHNLRFLFERLNSTRFEVLGHARHYISVVQNTTTLCPSVDEEVCISNLLTKFDEIITLHQRKLEHLNLKKKALLQKLFPKNGECYPELRFPGFTDAWEQRKLCQITTRVTRKNGGQSDLPLTISAQDGLVDQRKYFNRQVASRDMSNYYLIKKGEFAYNKSYSEGYPFGAVKRLDYYDIGALSTLYILFEITDNNISSDFIVSYYMTHLWYKEISKRAAEGARNHGLLNISTEDFFDSDLNIPNSIEEQVKIGNFIKQLDKFITLHQRKLDHLQLQKKALLQQMFV